MCVLKTMHAIDITWERLIPNFKQRFILLILCFAAISACTAKDNTNSVPSDFMLVMDAHSGQNDLNVNIRINAHGAGHFEYYDPGGVIQYDANDIVMYSANQVVKSGEFQLTQSELEQLWDTLKKNRFFELDGHYQMQLGYSYAFILLQANDQRHVVNNMGREVSEIRAIVEEADKLFPEEISLEYRKGFIR